MPRNAQGFYTLPAGNPVIPGTIIESTWANGTMTDIADALTGSLPRDGSAPMTGQLTLNGQTPTNARHAVDKQYVDGFMAFATGFPVGFIAPYGGGTAPAGWLKCDGSAVSRTTYATLFTAIGVTYGSGDGSTTFNLPDLRSEFIRGRPDSRAVGSKQAASFAAHVHVVNDPGHAHAQSAHTHGLNAHTHGVNDPGHSHTYTHWPPQGSADAGGERTSDQIQQTGSTSHVGTGISIQATGDFGMSAAQPGIAAATTGVSVGAAGGAETVPQNMALDYYIKAVNDSTGSPAITGLDSSDSQMIQIDTTNPVVPELLIHSNVAFGIPKLDASGKVPLSLLPTGSQQLLGYWDASSGQTPSQASPSTNYASGDTYIISVTGLLTVYDPVTLTASPTTVAVGSLLQYIENSLTNPTGWYYVVSTSTVVASQVAFTPTGSIAATNVQAALAEVDGDVVANAAAIATLQTSVAGKVAQTSATGAALIPAGSDAQRDTTQLGAMRYNTQQNVFEGLTTTGWGAVGGGISQGQADARYLQLTGGELSGNLTSVAAYVSTTQALAANALTRKDYVDTKVSKSGDTMTGPLSISAALPQLILNETDQPVDGRAWRLSNQESEFVIDTLNDAQSVSSAAIKIGRTGSLVAYQDFYTNNVKHLRLQSDGELISYKAAPSSPAALTRKDYVDTKLPLAGGALTGPLTSTRSITAKYDAEGGALRALRQGPDDASLEFMVQCVNAEGTTQYGGIYTRGNGYVGIVSDLGPCRVGGNSAAYPIEFLDGGGNIIAGVTNGTGEWAALSDRRAKQNIEPLTKYGLTTILALQPVQYQMKSNGAACIGFIAQDAEPIVPESVVPPVDDAAMYGMNQTAIVPILVKAIQELSTKLDTALARIAELEAAK